MVNPASFYNTLIENKVDFFSGVPDSLLKDLCAYITDHSPKQQNIIAPNEGCAVALTVGHYMATGNLPVVYMQNSGIGNAINPLLSLADEKVYQIPMILVIGWRGEPGIKDEPQHVKQGLVTIELLDAMNIPYIVLDSDEQQALKQTNTLITQARQTLKPHAIVIRKDVFDKYKLVNKPKNDYTLSREQALKIVVTNLPENSIVVSTTGKLSRELFELREENNESHERDFLTVGSMGHSSSIALGIALAKPLRKVVCFDGDGAMIMHMGALSSVGDLKPKNYLHILFNNGAHESVGGQPTVGFDIDFQKIALANGYSYTATAQTEKQIAQQLKKMSFIDGPILLEIKINQSSRDDLGRPTTTTVENKINFMEYVSK